MREEKYSGRRGGNTQGGEEEEGGATGERERVTISRCQPAHLHQHHNLLRNYVIKTLKRAKFVLNIDKYYLWLPEGWPITAPMTLKQRGLQPDKEVHLASVMGGKVGHRRPRELVVEK